MFTCRDCDSHIGESCDEDGKQGSFRDRRLRVLKKQTWTRNSPEGGLLQVSRMNMMMKMANVLFNRGSSPLINSFKVVFLRQW